MPFIQSAFATLKKYADFSGRASRQEFWYFFFFYLLAQMVARVIDAMLFRSGMLPGPVAGLVGLFLFLPQVAVTVRRLHDVGKSGKEAIVPFALLLAAPFVLYFGGFIGRIIQLGIVGIMLIMFASLLRLLVKKGGSIPNKYGAAPTAFSFAK